jgi:hypothetical protein
MYRQTGGWWNERQTEKWMDRWTDKCKVNGEMKDRHKEDEWTDRWTD